jgi:hypothetical protein
VNGQAAAQTMESVSPAPRVLADSSGARYRLPGSTSTRLLLEWTALGLLCAALLAVCAPLLSEGALPDVPTRTVKVSSGDTLWTLAARNPVPGLATADTVELIRHTNGLDGSAIQTGQLISVPSAAPQATAVVGR